MKPVHMFPLLLFLTVLAACRPEPATLEPEPEADTICFDRIEYVDRGPGIIPGVYEHAGPDYSFGYPVCHPTSPDTLVYFMGFDDGVSLTSRRQELWWHNLRDGSGAMIYRGHTFHHTDLSPGGWVAFSSARGVAVVQLDGSGLTYLQDGTWKPQWHPLGDTLFLEEAVAYQVDGQWIKQPYAETHFEVQKVPNSPDGKYSANFEAGSPHQIYVAEVASDVKDYLSLPEFVWPGGEMAWSADQRFLYVLGADTTAKDTNGIYYSGLFFRVNVQTDEVDRLREFDGITQTYMRFDATADGQHLITSRVFTDSVGGGVWYQRPEIWIMDADGCNERKLELPME